MAEETPDYVGAAQELREELGRQRLTAPLAKTYSQHVLLRTGQSGLGSWSEADFSNRLRDVIGLIEASFVGRENGAEDWQGSLRRAGELLEWMNHPEINTESLPFAALGAACYQIAGYPARASGLLAQHPDPEYPTAVIENLLDGDFPGLLSASLTLIAEAGEPAKTDSGDPVDELERLAFVEFARGLALLAAQLRWGDEARADAAVEIMDRIQTGLAPFLEPYVWLLMRLGAEVAAIARSSSLRNHLTLFEGITTDAGQEVLDRYARYAFAKQRSLAWPSQIQGYRRLAEQGSFALCAPTGAGKTAIAEVALLLGLFEHDRSGTISFDVEMSAPLCLYIVPTRALAAEVEGKLSTVLKSVSGSRAVTVTGLYGGTDWGPADVWLTKEEPTVLICTQEKAEALVRFFGFAFLHRLRLVILDEAHEVQDSSGPDGSSLLDSRSLRLETLVGRLRASLESRGTRFIAISAVAEEIERELALWISGGEDSDPVRSRYRSTRQLVGRLIVRGDRTRIEYDLLDGSPLEFEADASEGPFVPNAFPPIPPAPEMTGALKGTARVALWAAIKRARRHDDGEAPQSVLISIVYQRANFMGWVLQLLEKDWADLDLPVFFEEPTSGEDRELWERAVAMCLDYFGEESREYQLLRRGIAVHHGKMPGRLPGLLVRLIERRIVRVVLATSTLSQGVNLPFETVIVPTLARQEFITGREFGNLIGGAGRPGVSTEGQALVILQADHSSYRRNYRGYLGVISQLNEAAQDATPLSALASLIAHIGSGWESQEDLIEWLETTAPVDDEESEEDDLDALDALDGVLLASIEELTPPGGVEELSADAAEDLLKKAWAQTFAHYASAEEERLRDLYLVRGRALCATVYPEPLQRHRYYKATLPPRDAEALFALLDGAREHLASGEEFVDWDLQERFEYVAGTIELVSSMPKFELSPKVGRSKKTSWREVLAWWLLPEEAPNHPKSSQVADWHDYVATEFGYRFNWALGSLMSLITDETGEGDPLSPEDWDQTGLPWAVLWIKEMFMWGTLEPVGAYLLARGQADTRREANELASEYYAFRAASDDESPLLAPDAVRAWAMAQMEAKAGGETEPPPDRIEAELVRALEGKAANRTWRVLPVERDQVLEWREPAGFVLATSAAPQGWSSDFVRRYDFFLEPQSSQVVSRVFL
jgi:hypothetical protein